MEDYIKLIQFLKDNYNYNDEDICSFIVDNFDWKFFSMINDSIAIELMYEFEINLKLSIERQKNFTLKIKETFYSLTQEQIALIKKDKSDRVVSAAFVNLILNYFNDIPDIYDIFEIYYRDKDDFTMKLKDPFYSYPEGKGFKFLITDFNLSTYQVINTDFTEAFYDYATYSVGNTNSDMREEYVQYFLYHLIPFLLSKKDIKISEQIDSLKQYKETLLTCYDQLTILELSKSNIVLNNLKKTHSKMVDDVKKKISDIPKKYGTIALIDEAINNLLEIK